MNDWLTRQHPAAEKITRAVLILGFLSSAVWLGSWADRGGSPVDRILVWSFVVFAVGLAELFALLVVLAIFGRIDLTRAFYDKPTDEEGRQPAQDTVSLSRLQAFMWTLVVMVVYFHRVASQPRADELPAIPAELLMVMGISSAVYLTSKEMTRSKGQAAPESDTRQKGLPRGPRDTTRQSDPPKTGT